MKNLLKFVILVITILNSCLAQQYVTFLSGQVDTSIINKLGAISVVLEVYKESYSKIQGKLAQTFETGLNKNGSFSLRLTAQDVDAFSYGYISLSCKDSYRHISGEYVRYYMSELSPMEAGDSVHLNVNKTGQLFFTGKGAEKYNCMAEIYRYKIQTNEQMERKLFDKNDYHQIYQLESIKMDEEITGKIRILESYKTSIKPEIFQAMYYDAIATTLMPTFHPMSFHSDFVNAKYTIKEDSILLEQYLKKDYILEKSDHAKAQSAYFADLLFKLERLKFEVKARIKDPVKEYYEPGKINFKTLYQRLSSNYSGELRDKLITMAFLSLPKMELESRAFVARAEQDVKSPYYKKIIQNYAQQLNKAYPFALPDDQGVVHKLADYKGKLLIMDFWFTGCVWCGVLHSAMHPILERYKHNPNVVFFTVNVDKDENEWRKSLLDQAYSSPDYINLFTAGQGIKHPFPTEYGYNGFPQLLIIGKDGEVVSYNPPRPLHMEHGDIQQNKKTYKWTYNDASVLKNTSTQSFIKLIDDYLQNHLMNTFMSNVE
ncbi:Thiol-disulfide isomerase or thioredoxin [bacterium A37T11]|nr:Thiol-disulfide isomerase or thioredoxin [bacterium A37T11]